MKHPIRPATLGLASRALARMCFVLGAFAAGAAQATVLQFDQTRNPATRTDVEPAYAGADLPQDYGNRVSALTQIVSGGQYTYGNEGEGFTPNVEIAYSLGIPTASGNLQMWPFGYGGLTNVIFGTPGSQQINIQFTADPGYSVLLYGFDLAGYPGLDYTINGVAVLEGANVLFSQENVTVGGDPFPQPFTRFDFATPLSGNSLTLQIDYANIASGQQDNIGLDNLRLGQFPSPVPEPSTWVLFLLGGGMLAWVARGSARRNPRPGLA